VVDWQPASAKTQPWRKLWPPQPQAHGSSLNGVDDAPWTTWQPDEENPDEKPWYKWMNDPKFNPRPANKGPDPDPDPNPDPDPPSPLATITEGG
jgi:hypothetical protein